MKAIRTALTVSLLAALAFAQSDAQKTFAQLQKLNGTWAGTNAQGMPLKVTFRDTADGTAILSEIEGHGRENMISMLHLDNGRVLMTHYCSTGNQPRMQATLAPDGKAVAFDFLDATNLATPDAGHMQRVVFTMPDADHHTEEWTFADHGKTLKEVFTLTRTNILASKQ
jgi:hypothetical protein